MIRLSNGTSEGVGTETRLARLSLHTLWGLLITMSAGLILSCGSDKPTNPCGGIDAISSVLLTNPAYSPIDTSVYYFDSGAPKSYYDEFRQNCGAPFSRVVPTGIYRVRLNDDSPAELVLEGAIQPRISPDGKTMYCIRGSFEVWRMSLPNGQPEFIKDYEFSSPSWYGSDTLLAMSRSYGISLFDIRNDSIINIGLNGYSPDASVDKKICHIWGGAIYAFVSGEDQLLRSHSLYDVVNHLRWSPDGTEVTFESGSPPKIRVVNLVGQERVLSPGGETDPCFTADGDSILYIRRTGINTPLILDGQVWIMSAKDGSQKRPVTTWSRIRP